MLNVYIMKKTQSDSQGFYEICLAVNLSKYSILNDRIKN